MLSYQQMFSMLLGIVAIAVAVISIIAMTKLGECRDSLDQETRKNYNNYKEVLLYILIVLSGMFFTICAISLSVNPTLFGTYSSSFYVVALVYCGVSLGISLVTLIPGSRCSVFDEALINTLMSFAVMIIVGIAYTISKNCNPISTAIVGAPATAPTSTLPTVLTGANNTAIQKITFLSA